MNFGTVVIGAECNFFFNETLIFLKNSSGVSFDTKVCWLVRNFFVWIFNFFLIIFLKLVGGVFWQRRLSQAFFCAWAVNFMFTLLKMIGDEFWYQGFLYRVCFLSRAVNFLISPKLIEAQCWYHVFLVPQDFSSIDLWLLLYF